MTIVIALLLILGGIGIGSGIAELKHQRKEARRIWAEREALEARAADNRVSEQVKAAFATLEESAKTLHDLQHPQGCDCAYCEITGRNEPSTRELVVEELKGGADPDFVNAMRQKVKGLMWRNKELQDRILLLEEQINERDMERAAEYSNIRDKRMQQL